MSQSADWPSHLSATVTSLVDRTLVLHLSGEVDVDSGRPVAAVIATVPTDAPGVVLDLADVTLVSAAGYRWLTHAAAHLTDDGRRLVLANCRELVHTTLHQLGATGVVTVFDRVEAAVAALTDRPTAGGSALARVRAQASALPGLLQTRPVIEGATAVLQDRYRCPDDDRAFALLRESSQRHNIKLRTLAAAVLTTRPPKPGSPVWFAGRRRYRPPAITFRNPRREWRDNSGGSCPTCWTVPWPGWTPTAVTSH